MEQERVIEELDEDALPSNPGLIPGEVSSPVGVEEITLWVASARPKDKLIYFVGNLMEARYYSPEIDELGTFAWNMEREGKVRLFQVRVTELPEKLPTQHYLAMQKLTDWPTQGWNTSAGIIEAAARRYLPTAQAGSLRPDRASRPVQA
jgi:hypothetical protein